MPRFSITEEWVRGIEFSRTLYDVLKMMQNFMGNKTFSFSFVTQDHFVVMHSLNGTVKVPDGFRCKQEDSLFAHSFNSEKNLSIIKDSSLEPVKHPHLDMFNMRSYIGIPLVIRNELIGVFSVSCSESWDIQPSDIQAIKTVSKLIIHAMELHRQSVIDQLTGLYNKSQITEMIELHKNERFAVIIFDVDDFKQVNDGKGHTYGDKVLSLIGNVVLESMPKNAVAFRFGGDEFCILLPLSQEGEPEILVEKIQRNLRNKDGFSCSISAGISTSEMATTDTILELADQALYEAKRKGKNQWAISSPQQAFSV